MAGERLVGFLYIICIGIAVYDWYKYFKGDDLK